MKFKLIKKIEESSHYSYYILHVKRILIWKAVCCIFKDNDHDALIEAQIKAHEYRYPVAEFEL